MSIPAPSDDTAALMARLAERVANESKATGAPSEAVPAVKTIPRLCKNCFYHATDANICLLQPMDSQIIQTPKPVEKATMGPQGLQTRVEMQMQVRMETVPHPAPPDYKCGQHVFMFEQHSGNKLPFRWEYPASDMPKDTMKC